MAEIIKKELMLKGIDCNKCIYDLTKTIRLEKIDLNVDYENMNISFMVNDNNEYNRVIKTINLILSSHEHAVKIYEKSIESDAGKTLFIGKLTCSDCARKIESRVRAIAGVKSADLDFVNSKLNIVANNKSDIARVIEESKKIVKTIEPDALVEEEQDHDHSHMHLDSTAGIVKKTVFTFIISAILFLLGLFLELDFIFEITLYLLSYIIIGYSVIKKAIKSLIRGDIFNENSLMMIATIGAFFIGEYHEAVAVMTFYLVGEMFQDLAVDKSRKSISKLMDLKSEHANLLVDDEITEVDSGSVEVGSLIVVRPGEKIPLDGIIIEGETYVDTSSITGEGNPRYVSQDTEVLSGYINLDKALIIKTTKGYYDSTVYKIIEMVENASSKKAPMENFITKFARKYTPVVVFIALILAIIPPLVFKEEFNIWIYRALSFLVVSCPCALVISVPLGFYGGIGFASKNGILVKGGNYLEALKNLEEIIFDKTGTLTTGKFVIDKINSKDYSKEDLLELAAYGEYYSIHPIANAVKEAFGNSLDINRVKKYQEYAGLGISAQIDETNLLIGNETLLRNNNIEFEKSAEIGTILYLAIDGKYAGNIVILDKVKKEAKQVISDLKSSGVKKITMITGDKSSVAQSIASILGIDEVYAEVLPNEKVEILEQKVGKASKKIVFVGDGINDAPVLSVADIGISMGSVGSAAAIEASDIVIMNDDLSKITDSITIARKTTKVVWQNIIFALFIKVSVLVLAALGIINMWIAVFSDVGVSLIAILNATRILKMKLKKTDI